MARNTQLLQLVSMLRAEAGHSTSVSAGVDNLPSLKQGIRRTQELLYDDFDWPFLRIQPTIPLLAGERYYDLPSDMNMERIEDVGVWYNGDLRMIQRGIGFAHYNEVNSIDGERQSPVEAYDIRWTGTVEQIEVWPIPDSNGQTLQLKGIRKLRALVADADVADLDDQLIVLTEAANMLARAKSEDAPLKRQAAAARLLQLKGRTKGNSEPFIMGGGTNQAPQRGRTVIRIGR